MQFAITYLKFSYEIQLIIFESEINSQTAYKNECEHFLIMF